MPGKDCARVSITREISVPDPVKMERFKRVPSLGPRVLFFSGGTALKRAARELTRYTHNSIHIITPFDSGGSSAKLRQAFAMPAVGDIRNRLMALADQGVRGNPEIFELFAYRLPKTGARESLIQELEHMAQGQHPMVRCVPDPMRKIIRNHLHWFMQRMTDEFDPSGASIGNIILTGGYFENRRLLDPVIYIFTKLAAVRGVVRPVVAADLHLAAELEDGSVIVGQHLLTGKEAAPIDAAVKKMWLAKTLDDPTPVTTSIRKKMRERIAGAELICYPIGSFYSSVVANLLPEGVGRAVAANPCPKVFVPNTGKDPELHGLTLVDQVDRLLDLLVRDDPKTIKTENVLNFVLVDGRAEYPGGLDKAALRKRGVEVIDCELTSKESAPLLDERLLVPVLLSLT